MMTSATIEDPSQINTVAPYGAPMRKSGTMLQVIAIAMADTFIPMKSTENNNSDEDTHIH